MHDRVAFADIREKLVAQALALGRALYQACNIHKFDGGRRVFVGVIHLGEHVEALVRHRDHADIRLNGAKRIVGALCTGVGNSVEQGAFSDIRKPHDT